MSRRWMLSIRWKLLLAMLLSALITGISLFVTFTLASSLIEREPYSGLIKWGINTLGSTVILIIIGGALFVTCYTVFTRSIIAQLLQVQEDLKQISEGNFQLKAHRYSHDEIADISRRVHTAADELNRYINEIIDGLRSIADGKLDHTIPVKENHKLGDVAESINLMAQQLKQLIEEERRAEQSKNDLITGVSHDLRTPLTSILGFLEVLKDEHYRDEVEMMHYVDIAYSKSEHLKHLIDDLFEYTRMNNGMPLAREPLALDDFLHQLMGEYEPTLQKAGLMGRLIIEHPHLRINADGSLLVRAFGNIIHNAMQYGKEGKVVDVTLRREHEHATVTIANYGNPIPASDLPFIFDRFYRIDKSRSLETGGTGLGLAIARSIVELHEGTIRAESDSYRTAFKLSFPIDN
ncbi:sensor histidine kinase [Paenibacillus septentrionalis]|uniref:histidine kinase n=1 Tax=Paenibacillus septentrionalis TaxID=429342 RepID=A0ABW1UX81_9BACL